MPHTKAKPAAGGTARASEISANAPKRSISVDIKPKPFVQAKLPPHWHSYCVDKYLRVEVRYDA